MASNEDKVAEANWNRLQQALGEYLQAYQLVGYTTSGQRVFFSHANNPMEYDAVCKLNEQAADGEFPAGPL